MDKIAQFLGNGGIRPTRGNLTVNSSTAEHFDLIVVGGGPSGSTLATLVAMRGHRVLLLEKESFPRYQIGESLLPATVHGVCKLLGVTEELEAANFTKKLGGTFRWGSNPEPWTFAFAISPKLAGPTSFAYQVERMKFDKILIDNARRKGWTYVRSPPSPTSSRTASGSPACTTGMLMARHTR